MSVTRLKTVVKFPDTNFWNRLFPEPERENTIKVLKIKVDDVRVFILEKLVDFIA